MRENDMDDVETRKQAGLDELLAEGWKREDLSWFPPKPIGPPSSPPTDVRISRRNQETGAFDTKTEPLTPAQGERMAAERREFDEKRALGMWTIKHEAVVRKHREEVAAMLEAGRAALAPRWPMAAAELHYAMTAYSERYDRELPKAEVQALRDRVERLDQLAETLPPEAAEIVRLTKQAYCGPPAGKAVLFEACERMKAST